MTTLLFTLSTLFSLFGNPAVVPNSALDLKNYLTTRDR
jgi:hypothetical protein